MREDVTQPKKHPTFPSRTFLAPVACSNTQIPPPSPLFQHAPQPSECTPEKDLLLYLLPALLASKKGTENNKTVERDGDGTMCGFSVAAERYFWHASECPFEKGEVFRLGAFLNGASKHHSVRHGHRMAAYACDWSLVTLCACGGQRRSAGLRHVNCSRHLNSRSGEGRACLGDRRHIICISVAS